MREIKFRAWLPEAELMAYDVSFDASSGWANGNGVTYLQYTGLKDNNGKEIYEGDIVRDYNHGQAEKWWGAVVWQQVGFQVSYHKPSNKTWTDLTIFAEDKTTKWEVIGNIYENKELL